MDWDKIRVFLSVAEAGSFTHAGESLNLSQSAVSRQVSALEKSLNALLFHRHARGLILTEQGETLFKTARDVLSKITIAQAKISENKEQPKGPLRITTTMEFGAIWLIPRLPNFIKLYPDIDISLTLSDADLDLSMRQADVAIRMSPPRQPDLIQRHLMPIHYRVFGAPEYLKENGLPNTLGDLDNHRIIALDEDVKFPVEDANWLLEAGMVPGTRRHPALSVNTIYGVFRAIQSGLGIGAIPDYLSRRSRNLVELLSETPGPDSQAYFVYPEELLKSERVVVFRDFLIQQIADDLS
jgi:DNA-binding transcriptional LysR family regulator